MELDAAGDGMTCPKCNSAVSSDERFCTACGGEIAESPATGNKPLSPPTVVQLESNPAHRSARRWLLAISILTLISGIVMFLIQLHALDKDLHEAEIATSHLTPAERDELFKQEIGMTFQEAVDHDRGTLTLHLVVNIVLSCIYFGLWIWAKKNPYMAALIALILFLTVIVVSAVLEPKSLVQGILVKVLFVSALGKAVKAGAEARRLANIV
jgi:hypothetical protein